MKINRKGFTLIELLAVIAVLGLVLAISTYFIVVSITGSKGKATVISDTNIKEAARIYSVEDLNLGWKQKDGDSNNEYFCTTIYELQNKGLISKEITNIGNYVNKYIIIQKDSSTKVIKTIDVIDSDDENYEFCKSNFLSINNINIPNITASDNISSDNWHNSDFNLEVSSSNESSEIYYEYSIDTNNWIKYSSPISITVETKKTTYYARTCLGEDDNKICTTYAEYIVKLDKTPPAVNIIVYKKSTNEELNEGVHYSLESSDLLKWNGFGVTINYSMSDAISGMKDEFTTGYNSTNSSVLTDISTTTTQSKADSFTANISSSGYRRYNLKVCDNAGNCTEKDVYTKIDTVVPEVSYLSKEKNGDGYNYKFKCTVGLSGIARFFGTDTNAGHTSEDGTSEEINYYLASSKSANIYLTCASNALVDLNYTDDIKLHQAKRNAGWRFELTDINKKTYTAYVWSCSQFSASGNRTITTYNDSNPYPDHCGEDNPHTRTYTVSSSCPAGYTQLDNSSSCYQFFQSY